nr:ABC transporter permease [Desulfobacula sp.]
MLKLLRQSPLSARIGIGIVMLNILVALFAPLIAPYGETSVVGDVWESSSAKFYIGTDHLGRDLLTRMIYGGRNTIALAFITTA